MNVNLISFGYNHGALDGAFLVMDVRSIKNPYHDPTLRYLNGYDPRVQAEVLGNRRAEVILASALRQVHEQATAGTQNLTMGIGCTGGHHRSVAISLELSRRLEQEGYQVTLTHRDMKESKI